MAFHGHRGLIVPFFIFIFKKEILFCVLFLKMFFILRGIIVMISINNSTENGMVAAH